MTNFRNDEKKVRNCIRFNVTDEMKKVIETRAEKFDSTSQFIRAAIAFYIRNHPKK